MTEGVNASALQPSLYQAGTQRTGNIVPVCGCSCFCCEYVLLALAGFFAEPRGASTNTFKALCLALGIQ